MTTRERRIVVGVDDSLAALGALRWAVEEGSRRGDVVEAVRVRRGTLASSVLGPEQALEELELSITQALPRHPGAAALRRRVADGPAGAALVAAAAAADLLVVGTNRRGPLGEAVLGSVSHYCIRHASCPVVVVPARAEEESAHVYVTETVPGL